MIAALLRTRVVVVWLLLVAATALSWSLGGAEGGGSHGDRLPGVVILLVASFKIRLVGLYFMELREAPHALRGAFEVYCVLVAAVTVGFYLLA